MELFSLIWLCNQWYSDLTALVDKTGRPHKRADKQGDTLALFIVRELADTFDPTATEDKQRAEAARVLRQARDQLDRIVTGLESQSTIVGRSASMACG
jgi:hypothetical protein